MPQGLQVWDANGVLIVDTSSYVLKTGNINIGTVTSPGSYDLSALLGAGAQPLPIVQNNTRESPAPLVQISGNSLTWNYQAGSSSFNANLSVMLV